MTLTNYSELYNYYFNRTIEFSQRSIRKQFIKCKGQGRSYNFLHNPILNRLTDLKSKYELVNSKMYKPLLEIYNNRSDFYEPKFYHNIFNFEMLELFSDLKEKNNNYVVYISEFAKVNALSEVYRRYRYYSKIYEFMFEINEFEEFALWEIGNPNMSIEENELFKKYHNKLYPSSYLIHAKNDFKVREEFKICIENLWFPMTDKYLFEDLTSLDDFKKVFFDNWKSHSSKIYFKCSPEEASYILYMLKFAFKKLSFASISRSKLFYTQEGNIFSEDNLSKYKNKIIEEEQQTLNDLLGKVGLNITD